MSSWRCWHRQISKTHHILLGGLLGAYGSPSYARRFLRLSAYCCLETTASSPTEGDLSRGSVPQLPGHHAERRVRSDMNPKLPESLTCCPPVAARHREGAALLIEPCIQYSVDAGHLSPKRCQSPCGRASPLKDPHETICSDRWEMYDLLTRSTMATEYL